MSRLVKILLFVVIPVLVVIIGVSIYLISKKRADQFAVSSEISPWENIVNSTSEKPPLPTALSLDAVYKNVHESVRTRDYETFKQIASSERIWNVENPKKLVGETPKGEAIFELLTPRGKENFIKYSPYGVLIRAPNYDEVAAGDVVEKTPSTRPDIVLKDPLTGIQNRVKMTVWKYEVDLVYSYKPDSPDQGTGKVGFVWENGNWKYNGEYWTVDDYHAVSLTRGDSAQNSTSVSVTPEGGCQPQTVNVDVGGAVSWGSIFGRVYSISPNSDFWHSDYLYNDTFVKAFDKTGTYTYLVQQPTVEPQNAKECTIIVK